MYRTRDAFSYFPLPDGALFGRHSSGSIIRKKVQSTKGGGISRHLHFSEDEKRL
jgi:hypothetical protein